MADGRENEKGRGGCIPSIVGVLLQGVLGNCLESLLDVDGLLGTGFKVRDVSFGLAPCQSTLLRDL